MINAETDLELAEIVSGCEQWIASRKRGDKAG